MPSSALRAPDEHDFEPAEDPGDPCPNCLGPTVEGCVCWLCGAAFCEDCGKVEVVGSAKCDGCAPVYAVGCADGELYRTRSLRRAWEAATFYYQQGYYQEASVIVPDNADVDFDGVTDREQELLESWDQYEKGRSVHFHMCLKAEA